MNLLTTAIAQANNNQMPYHSMVSGDHTVYLPPQDILAVSHLSNFQLPYYPNDVFVEGYNPDPPLDSGAHAYVSRYTTGGSAAAQQTLSIMSLTDASNLHIQDCTSVTFTGSVFQGWMSMVGMVFTDGPATFKMGSAAQYAARVVYDSATGWVYHLALATVLPGATPPPASDFDEAVLAAVRHRVPDAELLLLVTDQRPRADHALRVDLENGRLHTVPPRTR